MKVTIIRSRAINPNVRKLADTLSRNGYEVRLLLWDRQGTIKGNSGDKYNTYLFKLKAPYDRYSALVYLPIWWIYEFFFLLRDKSDVLHACDLDTLIPAIIVKLFRKVKLCYTIYDFYSNNLPDGNFQLIRKFIRIIVSSVEKFGISFTEALFLVDECRYENIKGARIKKLVYIYNSPPDLAEHRQSKQSDEAINMGIFYAGIIHKSRGLEYLIDAIDGFDDVKLIIAGIGPNVDVIKRAAQHNQNISYLGQISYHEVISRSLDQDILFAMYDPIFPTNRYASPNKLFEAMMCGKPIIVNCGAAYADIVKKENCGLIVPYGSVDEIKNAILKLKNNPQIGKRLGENGRRAYDEKYSWKIMEKRLVDTYKYVEILVRN